MSRRGSPAAGALRQEHPVRHSGLFLLRGAAVLAGFDAALAAEGGCEAGKGHGDQSEAGGTTGRRNR